MNSPEGAIAVSPAPTLAASYSARLEWRSEVAHHVEHLQVRPGALNGDGRWLAAGEAAQRLKGEQALDAAPWCRPSGRSPILLDAGSPPLPADLHPGRHYPAHLFGRIVAGPRDAYPVQLLDIVPGGMKIDPNHPLAGRQVRLVLAPSSEDAAAGIRLTTLFDGPGMQVPPAAAAPCYFPPGALTRRDEASDLAFYARPRRVQHLDARCRAAIAGLHGRLLRPGARVLDLMASHDSHLPPTLELESCGLGLNGDELAANPHLAARVVQDLNANPALPWGASGFDAAICTASIEYLTRPHQIVEEVRRVLKPGGLFVISFSDRWFPTKAIAVWSELHAFERLGLALHLLNAAGFVDLHSETRRGLPRPPEDKYVGERPFADPLFAAWGYAPA